jgi:diguanylate cyclase (GGDEF)-like protein/PAS domain S-box-containing protein
MTGWYYGSLISAVNQTVSAAGGRLVAISTASFSSGYHREQVIENLPHLGWQRIEGFIAINDAVSLGYLQALAEAGKPVVSLGHQEPGFAYPSVLPDNHGGVKQAVDHLVQHGHTRIAFAGSGQYDPRERYTAFCDGLRAHGIEPDPALYYEIEDNHEFAGREAGRRMVAAGLPSTAVIAACDLNAIGIMSVLKEAGYLVPTDQAIIGYDDLPGNTLLSPTLSSVSQHSEEMGALAARLVMNLAAGKPVKPGAHIVGGSFTARESCGCAAKPSAHEVSQEDQHEDPVINFTAALAKAVRRGPTGPGSDFPVDKVNRLTGVIEGTLREAINYEITPQDLVQLSLACRELYTLGRNQATSDAILHFTRQLSSRLTQEVVDPSTALVTRLNSCITEVQLGLGKALLNERNEAYYDLRKAIRDEHEISVDLLRSHEADPRSLGWLARTKARAAILAMWAAPPAGPDADRDGSVVTGHNDLDLRKVGVEDPSSGTEGAEAAGDGSDGSVQGRPQLEVVGTYDSSGSALVAGNSTYSVECYPPVELLEAAGEGNVVLLFPVTSEERDWGILSVAVPLDSGFVGQDTYFQWEALLSEALDYQHVLQSLRDRSRQLHERGEQLALSYRREREMAQAVRESEERYALAARAANDGMWDWDLDKGTVYYSSRWSEMLGYPEAAISKTPEEWLDRVHADDRPGLMSELVSLKLGEQASILHEHRVKTREGGYIWVLCRGLAVPGVGKPATRIVGSLTDVTERRLLEERLRQQALYDALTGLPNRVLFLDRLAMGIANTKRRAGGTYTVLWLDLDGFKILNDSLGHQMGDKLLIQVADRIRAQLRESDTAARFGGDEFAVLLLDVPDLATVRVVVQRLLEHLGAIYDLEGNEIVVTASIGVAMSTVGYERPEDVLRDADIAMYRAKSKGRGTYAIFDSSMHATAMARLKTETELRQAIEPRGQDSTQMELHYQPVVDLATGDVMGLEALVRWRHPLRGLVTPLEFLQVAEDSGLIVPMGRWVAAQACRQLALWNSASIVSTDVRVSLNLSNREFWSPRLLDHLDLVLKESGVLPERLAFEITEGVIIDNLERALVVLHELHARGLQVHVDDFGTGYSSLQALHRLPIDALKIDKSFVAGLGHDERTAELVRTIVQLGKNLGVVVIAEGVETQGQHDCLRQLGCGCGQGYLFSPPVPGTGLETLIATGHFRPLERRRAAQEEELGGGHVGQVDHVGHVGAPHPVAGELTTARAAAPLTA